MGSGSLVAAVGDVLEQGQTLLACLDDREYARPIDDATSSSIGAHYRHVLDHFDCLLQGFSSGLVNYDRRQRGTELERSVSAASAATRKIMEGFRGLSGEVLRRGCKVVYAVGYAENEEQEVDSNFAREVMFCVGHAIHHYAILKWLCAGVGVRLPYEFGVAPSTLKHLETRVPA